MAHPNIQAITVDAFVQQVRAEYSLPKRKPIFGIGKPGVGKTVSLRDLAKDMGIGFLDIRLTNYTEVDLKGVPMPDEKTKTAVWYASSTLPNVEKHGEKGILLLDEITGASPPVRLGVYQLLEKGELESYKLPDGWYIVACGNNEEDMVEVYNELSIPLKDRGFVYSIVSDVSSFKMYGIQNAFHPLVLAYVSWSPESLHDMPTDPSDVSRSPRGWETVSDSLLYCEEGRLDGELMINRIAGAIGRYETEKFLTFTKFKEQIPDIEDILSNKISPNIDSSEILHITLQSCINTLVHEAEKDFNIDKEGFPSVRISERFANFANWFLSLDDLEVKAMAIGDLRNSMPTQRIVAIVLGKVFTSLCPKFQEFSLQSSGLFKS